MSYKQSFKISILIIIFTLLYLFKNNSAFSTLKVSKLIKISDPIKRNILKPFYETSNCIHFWSDSKNLKNYEESIKEAMTLTSLLINDNFETKLKECINILIFIENLDAFCVGNSFKTEKKNILILSFDTSSNNDFMTTQSSNFGISNVLVILINSDGIYHLNPPTEQDRPFVKKTLFLIKSWTTPEKKLPNLQGRNITVATFHYPIYTIVDSMKGKDNVQGIEMLIVKELARQLNFTISLHLIEDTNKWGTFLKNGTWINGIMGVMSRGFAELGFCSLFIEYTRSLVLDYTPSWSKLYVTFLVPHPHRLDYHWQSIFHPFGIHLWLGIMASVVVTSSFQWITYWVKYNLGINQKPISFQTSTFGIIGALTIGSHILYTNNNNRYLVTSWYIFVLVITTAFSSSIVARLTLPVHGEKIDTVQQLVENNFFWGTNYKASFEDLFNMENIWHHKFVNTFKTVEAEDLSELISTKQFAVIANRLNNDYVFTEFTNISDSELGQLGVMKESTREYQISISFRKYSPLHPICSRIIQRVIEAGIVQYWIQDVSRHYGRKAIFNMMFENERPKPADPVKLTFNNLQGTFYLLLFGHCLGVVSFMIECINFRLHSSQILLLSPQNFAMKKS